MLLNTSIFNTVVETAKAKCVGNPAMLRAFDRAVYEIHRTKYWAFDAQTGVLKIKSTTSGKLYIVDDGHTCEARTVCKHKVARRLMQRYAEALGVASVETKQTKPAPTLTRLAEAAAAPFVPRTLTGDTYCGVAI